MAQIAARGTESKSAFNALYAAYDWLLTHRLRRLHMQDFAEDLAQEIWMDVVRAAPRYDPQRQPVRIYLNGFVRTAVSDHRSKLKSSPRTVSNADEAVSEEMDAAMLSMLDWRADITLSLDLQRCMRRALAEFERAHPRLATLLKRRYVDDWSLEKTAQELGGTANQVKAQTYTARQRIRPFARDCYELLPDAKARRT